MKTLYLHIGLGKTGTTSIQKFLSDNHVELRTHGVHYILAGGGGSAGGHQCLAKSCIENVPSYMEFGGDPEADLKNILSEIESSIEQTILLSAENFQLAEPQLVKKAFEQYENRYVFKIVLFVRSQDELVESEYNQLIKVRNECRTLDEYLVSEFEGDYWGLASQWAEVFGRESMICRVYDAAKNAISDFFTCLPITCESMSRMLAQDELSINESLGAVELHRKLRRNENHIREMVGDKSYQKAVLDSQVPAVIMNSHSAQKIRERYTRSNLLFSEHFLGNRLADLGGRRYSDQQRDEYYSYWETLMKQS